MKKDDLVGFDEAYENILRTLPYSLYSYFKKLKEEGFNKDQAFILTRDFQKGLWHNANKNTLDLDNDLDNEE